MDEHEALQAVAPLGGGAPDPALALAIWRRATEAVRARANIEVSLAGLVARPVPREAESLSADFLSRPDLREFVDNGWEVRILDLTQVLAFQKTVFLHDWPRRTASAAVHDPAALFQLCLPDRDLSPPLVALADATSFTYSSPNPNLRVGRRLNHSFEIPTGRGPGRQCRISGFEVIFGNPFVQAVEVGGRVVLRDGYHRCHALMQLGVSQVPALFCATQAEGALELCEHPGFIDLDVLFGPRPPRLGDFADPAVSYTGQRRAVRKVVRIHADEFYIRSHRGRGGARGWGFRNRPGRCRLAGVRKEGRGRAA